jgi:hypothetical protein
LIETRLYFPGFPVPAFLGTLALLNFLFPGENVRESRKVKYEECFYNTKNGVMSFSTVCEVKLVSRDPGKCPGNYTFIHTFPGIG